jgi:predicted DCC family thiol-disulfide oxidoreductase YuxK
LRKWRLIVFYDGWCLMCQSAKKAIERADWFGAIKFLSFREKEIMEKYELYDKNVEERIYCLNEKNGMSYSGIETMREIAKRIPLYWIFTPVLSLSIRLGFGQKFYDYIAMKRKIIPVGNCQSQGCEIHSKVSHND